MGEKTNIAWCSSTVNFWEGCTKVSPACANCYAAARDERWHRGIHWGNGAPRRRSKSAEATARRLNALAGKTPGKVHRVFSLSLGDWLDEEVPIEWLADMLKVVSETPNLTWLLLTKRPENALERMLRVAHACFNVGLTAWLSNWIQSDNVPENVHLGVTVENQAMADKRIPELLKIPAHRRFLSCEPLLSEIKLPNLKRVHHRCVEGHCSFNYSPPDCKTCHGTGWMYSGGGIHQVIVGGESGPGHRPLNLDWMRSIKDQCNAAGVAYFSKQDSGPRAGMRGRIPDDLWAQEETR